MSTLCIKSHFSSAHLYHQPLWDQDKNRETFGRCFTNHGHGHNYILEVGFVLGETQPPLPLSEIAAEKQALLGALTNVLDHEHLNFTIPEFSNLVPTSENIALYFLKKLKSEKVSFVRIYETPDLWAEVICDNTQGLKHD